MKSKLLNRFLLTVGPTLAIGYLAVIRWTTRIHTEGLEEVLARVERGENFLFASWHSRLILEGVFFRGNKGVIMIGRHSDAEYFARILGHYGFVMARGSTSRGGITALKTLIDYVKAGFHGAIVPDGPRGPACIVQMGIIEAAKVTGRPIIPVANAVRRQFRVRSWDRMMIPLPFTTGVHIAGEPIEVPPDADAAMMEQKRLELQESLNRITARADDYVEGSGLGSRVSGIG